MMGNLLQINFRKPIPLFPLPNCVLLPGATIPLHIFEARYRAMTSNVLASDNLIAMGLFEGDQWKTNYEGNPPVRPFTCVSYIVHHDCLSDGRYHLWLQGVCRARIVEEIEHEPYRMVHLEPSDTSKVLEIDLCEERQRIESRLSDDLLSRLTTVRAVKNMLNQEIPTVTLIDLTTMSVCENCDDRYWILSEPQVSRRFKFLDHHLAQIRRTLEMSDRLRPPDSPEGVTVN